jgi:hypothetical protein
MAELSNDVLFESERSQPAWCELARQVQEEKDPQRLMELVRRLIAALEEDGRRKKATF